MSVVCDRVRVRVWVRVIAVVSIVRAARVEIVSVVRDRVRVRVIAVVSIGRVHEHARVAEK